MLIEITPREAAEICHGLKTSCYIFTNKAWVAEMCKRIEDAYKKSVEGKSTRRCAMKEEHEKKS